jgi:hypothetical protein
MSSALPLKQHGVICKVLATGLLKNGVKVTSFGGKRLRMVTHYGIESEDVDTVLNVCNRMLA